MREFRKKKHTPFWKRFLDGLLYFFYSAGHRGAMRDHDERMKKRRRKTKFHK